MTNDVDKNTINELLSRINYHILLELMEISSLISPETYLENLTSLGFIDEEILLVKNANVREKFNIMMDKLNNKTHNTCENINAVKSYMNNKLKPHYKAILFENLKTYEYDKKFHEILA